MYDAGYTGRFSDNDRKGRNFCRIAAVDVQLGALSKCTIAAGIRGVEYRVFVMSFTQSRHVYIRALHAIHIRGPGRDENFIP